MGKKMAALFLAVVIMAAVLPLSANATGKTADQAVSWVRSKIGSGIDYDGYYGCQCVDLIMAYYEYLGVPISGGNAAEYAWNTLPAGWERIQGAQPQKGDILVYAANSDNPYGHVGVYESDYSHYHQNVDGLYGVVQRTCHYTAFGNPYWGVVRPNWGGQGATMTLDAPWVEWVTETNAKLCSVIRCDGAPVYSSSYGVSIWDDKNSLIYSGGDSIPSNHQGYGYISVWFDLTAELGVVLQPGKDYTYNFFAWDGTKYVGSPKSSFKTAGTSSKTCTLSFSTGVSVSIPAQSKTDTEDALTFTIPATKLEKDGYTFLGWSVSPSADTAGYQPGSSITISQDTTLYAVWQKKDDGETSGGDMDASVFVDVQADAYYADAVAWALQNKITSGTGETTFSPHGFCSRAQAVTFLWRAFGRPEPKTTVNPFTDVRPGDYYYKAVLWAVGNGVTSGTSTTTFSPNDTCSRAQIVTFLWRSAGSPVVGNTGVFSDVKASSYYVNAVDWAVHTGVTSGTSKTTFSPNSDCVRGQIVTFLYRYLQ